MAFETGTATSIGNLMYKLFIFAQANGYTLDQPIVGTNPATPFECALSKGSIFVGFKTGTNYFGDQLNMYPARGFTPGQTVGNHPETGTLIPTVPVNGAISSYHFFEGDDYLHVVLRMSDGRHRHLGWGSMTKFGDWADGEYFYGHLYTKNENGLPDSYDSQSSKLPFQYTCQGVSTEFYGAKNNGDELIAGQGNWHTNDRYNSCIMLEGAFGSILGPIITQRASGFNGFSPLFPLRFGLVNRTISPQGLHYMGAVPNVRFVDVGTADTVTERVIGSDTWLIFPLGVGGAGIDTGNRKEGTGYMGLAYKKVTT